MDAVWRERVSKTGLPPIQWRAILSFRDLAAIADSVEQGRTILSNIRRSVHFTISTNLSEIAVLLAVCSLPATYSKPRSSFFGSIW